MNETLSNIVADLFARSQGIEEISSHILHLRAEISKSTEREDAIYGKFRGLLESFREVIPDEKQRYQAAIKALSTTSKLSQQEIIKAIGGQIEELKILEKSLLSPLPGWRDGLKAMEARAKEKQGEIAKLREQMARLETEEEGIRKGKAAREQIMELAEKAMKELFADIGSEITSIKKKADEVTVESPAPQPVPQPPPPKEAVKSDLSVENKSDGEPTVEISTAPAPVNSAFQKKCPMCGGQMNLQAENLWMCYTCAYEEANEAPSAGKQKSAVRAPSAPLETTGQKKCPMCGGKMDYLNTERMWQCYSCAHEEPSEDAGAGAVRADAPPPSFGITLADLAPKEHQEPKKRSAATKTKTCPSCKKKMYWYPDENAWRCPSCFYETRSFK